MAVSERERERRELQEALVGTIGPEPTDTLLSYLPPVGWADVATKRDLDNFAAQLRLEMAEMRTELRTELADLRTSIAGVRADLRTEIAGVRADLRTSIAGVRADLRTEIAGVRADLTANIADLRTEGTSQIAALRSDVTDKLNSQLRWLVGLFVLVILTVVGTGVLTR